MFEVGEEGDELGPFENTVAEVTFTASEEDAFFGGEEAVDDKEGEGSDTGSNGSNEKEFEHVGGG